MKRFLIGFNDGKTKRSISIKAESPEEAIETAKEIALDAGIDFLDARIIREE